MKAINHNLEELIRAIFRQAARDYVYSENPKHVKSSLKYFASAEFQWHCDVLDCDPEYLLKKVAKLKAREDAQKEAQNAKN